MPFYFFLFIIAFRWTIVESVNSCRDENNSLLDWFVLYKIPTLQDHPNPLIKSGVAYAYMSSANEGGWIISEKSINDSTSMPGRTLWPIYETSSNSISELRVAGQPDEFLIYQKQGNVKENSKMAQNQFYDNLEELYVFYNDQPPVGNVSFTGGHTKGVVYAEESGGFWLVHSVPHYPPLPKVDQYSYPKTGLKNGQSFLCISLHSDQLDLVGIQLMFNNPHIFASSTPGNLQKKYPILTNATSGVIVNTPPWYHSESVVSAGGITFQAFAKSPMFNKDLYSGWVSAALEVDLLVETWPNGVGHLNSSCHQPFRVENVQGVKLDIVGEAFSSHKDHSKWAVSEAIKKPWVCIGDINRATTQAFRGGGTVCLKNTFLWQAYRNSVNSIENCPRK